jgi:hypothetical protein
MPLATAVVTYSVVAICVLLDADGGVNAREIFATVWVPEPATVTLTSGLKVEDVDTDGEDHAQDYQRYMFKAIKWIDARVGPAFVKG